MVCIDTNLLIYAHRAGTREHGAAQTAIERAAAGRGGWGLALPSIGEFWAQVTHPRFPGGASTSEQAAGFIWALVNEGGAKVFLPRADFPSLFLETVAELGVSGPRVFDVQIALLARAAGATRLWTHDAGFVRLPGLQVEDPLAAPASGARSTA